MGTDIGAKIGIDGEAAFRSSLAAINSQLKNLGSEMKSVISAFSGMENSEGAVTAKGDVLKRSLNASAEKMKLLQTRASAQRQDLQPCRMSWKNPSRSLGRTARRPERRRMPTIDRLRP